MLNMLLFSKLPYEIRFTIYIGLLTYCKKRLIIKDVIDEINDLSKINLIYSLLPFPPILVMYCFFK